MVSSEKVTMLYTAYRYDNKCMTFSDSSFANIQISHPVRCSTTFAKQKTQQALFFLKLGLIDEGFRRRI